MEMEENKKYLNEKKYQKVKKGLIVIAIIVAVIGLSIGGYLIKTGVEKIIKANKEEKLYKAQEPQRIAELEKQIATLTTQETSLEKKQREEFRKNRYE